MATPQLDFYGVLSESKKIMESHSRHFLALSVLFLLPLSFSIIFFPTLQTSITNSDTKSAEILLRYDRHQKQNIGFKTISLSFLYAFLLLTLSLCATATITFSVYNGFFGRPVKLVSAIKSLTISLVRLFATFLCSQLIIFAVFVTVGLIIFVIIKGIEFLGFQISNYFSIAYIIGMVVLGLGLMYLQVNWVLAPVIVVVESSWGLEPLRRSSYLVKGMRGVVVCMLLFFGAIAWLCVFGSWESAIGLGILRALMFVVQTVLVSTVLMILFLYSLAANTVLYMYCKALHGELAGEIAEEFSREYVSLPFDEEKVPHVVSVVQP